MYIPEFPSHRNLTCDDKMLLDVFYHSIQPRISELTFTNLFVWNNSEPVLLSRLEETIMLQRTRIRDAKTCLLPPLGNQFISDFVSSIRTQNTNNHLPPLYGLTAEEAEMLAEEGWKTTSDRDDWDYVYLVSDLADLPYDCYFSLVVSLLALVFHGLYGFSQCLKAL